MKSHIIKQEGKNETKQNIRVGYEEERKILKILLILNINKQSDFIYAFLVRLESRKEIKEEVKISKWDAWGFVSLH